MSLRPYWKRHPVQARVCAALLLIVSPVLVPAIIVVVHWGEVVEQVRDLWKVMRTGT